MRPNPRKNWINWKRIHREISIVSKSRFEGGHYADAVEAALKQVNERVKKYYRYKTDQEQDGASLMRHAFSPANPIIRIGDLDTETGRNMQQGYMDIFAGSMTGIRNPKAHTNIRISPTLAIHFLFLASLLMNKLDDARVPRIKRIPCLGSRSSATLERPLYGLHNSPS